MKTIGCVGCSWTYGYGLEREDTYPGILSDRFPDVKVINAGHCGADIEYAIYASTKIIEKYKPKIIFFQLTTLDRMTIGTDGFENFINNRFVDDRKEEIYSINDRLLGIGDNIKTKIAVGSYITEDSFKEYTESQIKATKEEYKTFVKILYENVIFSNYNFYKTKNNLKIFDEFAKSKKCKVYYFRWLDSIPIQVLAEDLNFIENSVESLIEKNLYIDNGFHLSRLGNLQLVENFMLPILEREL